MQENYTSDSEEQDYSGPQSDQMPIPPQSQQYDRIIQEEKVSNFISQTSPTRNMHKIDKILKGYFLDESKNEWIKVSNGIPSQIRMDYLQFLTPFLSEDVRMGRMDRVSINNIMNLVIEWSIIYLDSVADDYYLYATHEYKEIKNEDEKLSLIKEKKQIGISEEQLSKIHNLICAAVAIVLWRSENGVERDRIYGALKLGDDFSAYGRQEEKKGGIGSFLPWK